MLADSHGNIYVAGTTSSPGFAVVDAWQPQIGESNAMRSSDSGANRTELTTPSAGLSNPSEPVNPHVLFGAAATANRLLTPAVEHALLASAFNRRGTGSRELTMRLRAHS